MKIKIFVLLFILLVVISCVLGILWNRHLNEALYEDAITALSEGKPDVAIEKLEAVNQKCDLEDELYSYIYYGISPSGTYYGDSWVLYSYALSLKEYHRNENLGLVEMYLTAIPYDYKGVLCDEIQNFRNRVTPEIAEYKAELKRMEEELEQEYLDSIKNKIPYEGMNEKYIDLTVMGKHHKYKSEVVGKGMRWETTVHEYRWENTEGDTILYVDCEDGAVRTVIKYGEGYFWTEDGKPIFSAKNPYRHISGKSSKKKDEKDDPYNVYDYSDPEDFYYDNYDDFWEYEEAEDYFNEHHY